MKNEAATAAKDQLTIALAGNPNAGKTTLFNALTGLSQKVANYPGVTVEKKEGSWKLGDSTARLIDIPGIYSLETSSLDEEIARDVITGKLGGLGKPDVIIVVVDATNIERNLYLLTQLYQYHVPMVIALTMIDLFEGNEHIIDINKLGSALKVPVIPVNAKTGRGVEELEKAVVNASRSVAEPALVLNGGSETAHIFARYNFISDAVQDSVKHSITATQNFSDKVDKVLTHRVFGLIFLIAILLLIFQTIFSWASLPMDLLDAGFGTLGEIVGAQLPDGMLKDLIVDGIIAGVGGVLIFLPQIILLFLFISVLEDSGYTARAAFLLDKLMSRVGLNGKAFLPLMGSFACAIPGVMAARTIEDNRDRLTTIMIAPLMSCSARLPVYTLMIACFFADQTIFGGIATGAVVMLAMYMLGIVAAILIAFVLKRTLLKSGTSTFIMELPPYRMPSLRTVLQNTLDRGWLFVKRAGTVILTLSIILWALMYFPRSEPAASPDLPETVMTADAPESAESEVAKVAESEHLANSYAGMIGHAIEPAIQPLGFDWKIGIALVASFAAREVLVSTISIIYSVGKDAEADDATLVSAVREAKRPDGTNVWTPLTAVSLMVFFVLAMQCISTVGIVLRETNSWKWTLFQVGYMTALAYFGSLIVYQGGKLMGFE